MLRFFGLEVIGRPHGSRTAGGRLLQKGLPFRDRREQGLNLLAEHRIAGADVVQITALRRRARSTRIRRMTSDAMA